MAKKEMTNEEKIKMLLKEYGKQTQKELSFLIYHDYDHIRNIHHNLETLLKLNEIGRTKEKKSYCYYLTSEDHPTDSVGEENKVTKAAENNHCTGNVIILNKPFLGNWLDSEGNIAHEIIDFLFTDGGDYYVYNEPRGVCPDEIWVEGTTDSAKSGKEKYLAKYLVLTSKSTKNEDETYSFNIQHVIELSEKLHRYNIPDDCNKFRTNQDEVKKIIRARNIRYNGKFLDEIYHNDGTLYVTFKASRVYKADIPIKFNEKEHKFQRNKGYIKDDEYPNDYVNLKKTIEDAIANGDLVNIELKRVISKDIEELKYRSTFINLIMQEDNEQISTNILYSILGQGDLLKHFCERFKGDKTFNSSENFRVLREFNVEGGRIDVCAESENQRVIIENKIDSGLNGVKKEDNITQLTTYYKWGCADGKSTEPLCFVVAPTYRKSEIEEEIKKLDGNMEEVYSVKTYGDIADFIQAEHEAGNIPSTYIYKDLIDQIIQAYRNLSYSKETLYAGQFLEATK